MSSVVNCNGGGKPLTYYYKGALNNGAKITAWNNVDAGIYIVTIWIINYALASGSSEPGPVYISINNSSNYSESNEWANEKCIYVSGGGDNNKGKFGSIIFSLDNNNNTIGFLNAAGLNGGYSSIRVKMQLLKLR